MHAHTHTHTHRVHCSCLQTHQKRASDSIMDGCEPPCGCWELNSGPLEEQSVLLTTEPSLRPSYSISASSSAHIPGPWGEGFKGKKITFRTEYSKVSPAPRFSHLSNFISFSHLFHFLILFQGQPTLGLQNRLICAESDDEGRQSQCHR